MRIAILGGGFTGLTAAYRLLKNNHQVTIFERNKFLGGLAAGIKTTLDETLPWEWDLEQFYHHWFTNDNFVFELGKEIGVEEKFVIKRPTSSILYHNKLYPFDSPINVMLFPHLNLTDKFKTSLELAKLKYLINQEKSVQFENITAHDYLLKNMGEGSYKLLWEPLLKGKFGNYYQEVSMRWFWARIYKRTPSLAYYQGGFSAFVNDIAKKIQDMGGDVRTGTEVNKIIPQPDRKFELNGEIYDRVIVTTPPGTLNKLIDNLPTEYTNRLTSTKGLGAQVILLSLYHPLMQNTYWLNVNDLCWPFLAVVEHTNFMPKDKYNNENLVYIGNYLEASHPYMQKTVEELVYEFTPYLKRINPLFSSESIRRQYVFQTPYAQPIVGLNHEQKILPLETPVGGVYLASMAQVYPWDRGTNYAIELGNKIAHIIDKNP